MQRIISGTSSIKLPQPETISVSESDKESQLEDSHEEANEMANLCTSRNSIFPPMIATRPLNLTLLSKRKRQEQREEIIQCSDEEDEAKKPRVGEQHDENSIQDSEEREHVKSEESQEGETEQKDSKASILQHFYSFIQRKVDKGELDSKHASDGTSGDNEEGHRSPVGQSKGSPPHPFPQFTPVISRTDSKPPQERPGSPQAPNEPSYGLDYNSIISRQLARASATNLIDFWSSVAGSMYARASHNSDDGSHHGSSPPMPGILNEYDTKSSSANSFTNSPTPNAIPERTMRQNNWAVKVWRDWAIDRNARANAQGKTGPQDIVPLDIKDASLEGMSYWLPRFITEVRRRDKRPYPPDTLMQIASGLQRHLRHVSGRNDITFFDKYSPTFAEFREALKARSEAINSETSQSQRGNDNELSGDSGFAATDAWGSSLFNLNSAKGIFRAIFYYNCVAFHITSMEEHHALLVSQYKLGFDEEKRQEYVEFTRDSGSQPVRKYSVPYDPRCIVKVFKIYFQHIPSAGLLYKRPLQSSESSDLRFSFNPVGINKLRETFKLLFGGRRSGCHISGIEEDEEKEVPMHPLLRLHSNTDDTLRTSQLERSPGSDVSSGASFPRSRRGSGAENHHPQDGADTAEQVQPPQRMTELVDKETAEHDEPLNNQVARLYNPTTRPKILVENNNNNATTPDEDDCLTLKVPAYVKYVIIQQGSRRIKLNLETMT